MDDSVFIRLSLKQYLKEVFVTLGDLDQKLLPYKLPKNPCNFCQKLYFVLKDNKNTSLNKYMHRKD